MVWFFCFRLKSLCFKSCLAGARLKFWEEGFGRGKPKLALPKACTASRDKRGGRLFLIRVCSPSGFMDAAILLAIYWVYLYVVRAQRLSLRCSHPGLFLTLQGKIKTVTKGLSCKGVAIIIKLALSNEKHITPKSLVHFRVECFCFLEESLKSGRNSFILLEIT